MKLIAGIQARMGSSRLPGKMMMPLQGVPVIGHVIDRVRSVRNIDEVFLLTGLDKRNLPLVEFAASREVCVYAGSEDDVLDRYYQVLRITGAEHIVRITGDCPLIDPLIIEQVIDRHRKEGADYTTNTLEPTYPDGLDVEVFGGHAIEYAWKHSQKKSEREHVGPFIRNHPDLFKQVNVSYKEDLSDYRWTLDTSEDFLLIEKIMGELYPKNPIFGFEETRAFIESRPELSRINSKYSRNEGYQKSLVEDEEG